MTIIIIINTNYNIIISHHHHQYLHLLKQQQQLIAKTATNQRRTRNICTCTFELVWKYWQCSVLLRKKNPTHRSFLGRFQKLMYSCSVQLFPILERGMTRDPCHLCVLQTFSLTDLRHTLNANLYI